MKVIEGNFGKPVNRVSSELSKQLRELADKVDNGQVVAFTAAYADETGEYKMMLASSLVDSLVLATLLKAHITDKFRE